MHFDSQIAYRRNLPHIVPAERPLFVTAATHDRQRLPPGARTLILRHILHEHLVRLFVYAAVVMPDHMHVIFELLGDASLASVMKSIKGVSSRRINQLLGRQGHIWQDESFDHVMRMKERTREKYEYVCLNPVRAGLVRTPDEYPWRWRSWLEGGHPWDGTGVRP